MNEGGERLAGRQDLFLLGFGGLFLLVLVSLAVRIFQAGGFLFSALIEECLAECSRLMTLSVSVIDGADLFAVLALSGLLLSALGKSIAQARKVRAFSRSLIKVELPPRLLRLLGESGLSYGMVTLFPDRLSVAFTAGLLRPRVFISTSLIESLSDEEVKAVLLHEQSHLRRLDPLRGAIVHFIAQFFLYLPRGKRLLESFKLDSELIADRRALSAACPASVLASALVKTKRKNLGIAEGLAGFAGDDFLGERLSRILNADLRDKGSLNARRLSPGRVLAGAVLAVSLAVVVFPRGRGFLETEPWRCARPEPSSCCATDAPAGHHLHCRS